MSHPKDKWSQLDAPPPPLFTGKKERNFVKQINDEAIERVVGQQVLYFPLSIQQTDYHSLYGEAIEKTFLPPVRVYAFINWEDMETEYTKYGVDRRTSIRINFHKKRLTADQDLYVRVGDFVKYGSFFYEVVKLSEPTQLFGQVENRFEITATCIRAREGKFNAK